MLPGAARDISARVRGVREGLTRWKYVRLLSGVYLAMFLIRVAFGIVIVTFSRYVTANDFLYGLVVASEPLVELIGVLFVGLAVDRYGRKGILVGGLGLASAVLFGFAFVPSQHLLILTLLNGAHGLAAAMILVTTLAIIASYAPPEHRGREMGLFNFANMFGYMAGAAAGSAMLDLVHDLRYTFVVAGALAAFGLVYALVTVKEPAERHAAMQRPRLSEVFAKRAVLLLALAWFLVFIFIGSVVSYFGRATTGGPLGASGRLVALGVLGAGATFVASQLLFGRLADRVGRNAMMLVGAAGFAALMLTIFLGTVAGTRTDEAVVAVVDARWPVLLLFAVLSLAFAPAGLAALADEAKTGREGATMSIWSVTLNLGFIVGPPLVGAVSEARGVFGVVVFFLAVSGALIGVVVWRMRAR